MFLLFNIVCVVCTSACAASSTVKLVSVEMSSIQHTDTHKAPFATSVRFIVCARVCVCEKVGLTAILSSP